MHRAARVLATLVCGFTLHAQNAPGQTQASGLETEWDIGAVLGEASAHAGRVLAALERIDARAWIAKGASETYAEQLESCKQQARGVADEAKALASDPEKLSPLLQVLFRMDAVESMAGSLAEGLRRFQSQADGQALAALAAENGANRERVRRYVVDLAAQREKQLQIMDSEAQRCRGILASQPPAVQPGQGRKK